MQDKATCDDLKKRVRELEKINSKLVANKKKFNSFFNHAGISVCMIDVQTDRFVEFNDVAHELLGYTREEFSELTVHDIDSSFNEKSIPERQKLNERGAYVFETVHRTKSGDLKNMFISYIPIEIEGKRFIQSVHIDMSNQKKIEVALKESEERYRTIIDMIPEGIIIADRGIVHFVNNVYLKMMGLSESVDITGKHISEVLKHVSAEGEDQEVMTEEVDSNIPRNNFVLKFIFPDKRRLFCRIYSTRIEYMGKPVILNVLHDITKEKETEEELISREKRFRDMVENSKDAIFITDFEDNIIEANRYACESLGYTREELLSISMNEIDVSVVPEKNIKVLENLIPGVPLTSEGIHRRKDGTTFPIEVRLSLFESGDRKLICGMVRDITERKLVEEKLKDAIKTAEEASQYKSEFLANMSHEIRTPMNGVIGMAGLMLDTPLNSEQKEYLDTIKKSADSLLSIINDILDFSKIEAGRLDLEILDFNLRNAIGEIMDLPSVNAHEKGLEFSYYIEPDIPSLIKGDPGRLRQILVNLINNAVKFTEYGEVTISLLLENETDSDITVRFEVKDTGIGISQNDAKKLFQSFQQVDASTTRKYGGTGLGLSISKRLAEMMGGKVGVESEPAKGSTFWFTAVFEKQPNAREDDQVIPDDIKDKRLLIVDDSNTNLKILGGYLAAWSINYDEAQSAEVALKLIKAVSKVGAPYDLIITDMHMPGMDGMEMGKIIRADQALKDVKMIMFTSRGIRGDYTAMRKVGFDAYLIKPVRRSQLYDCIIAVLAQKKRKDETEEKPLITRHTIIDDKLKKAKILIAEDNIINQKLALRLLEKFGYQADAVVNGREAINALEIIKYDIVLMDIQMPVMDGYEATRKIRDPGSKVLNHDVKIIALTAHAMKGDREKCLENGMDDYVIKPINPNELYSVIDKHLTLTME